MVKRGRQPDYSEKIADLICSHIASGGSMSSWCRRGGNPSLTSVYKWLRRYPEFAKNYAIAREDRADTHADEITAISDQTPRMIVDEKGITRIDTGDVQNRRLRVDSRKFIASKLKPRVYGEHLDVSGLIDVTSGMDRKGLIMEAARSMLFIMTEAMKNRELNPPIEHEEGYGQTEDQQDLGGGEGLEDGNRGGDAGSSDGTLDGESGDCPIDGDIGGNT